MGVLPHVTLPRGSKRGVKTAAHMYHPSYREYPPGTTCPRGSAKTARLLHFSRLQLEVQNGGQNRGAYLLTLKEGVVVVITIIIIIIIIIIISSSSSSTSIIIMIINGWKKSRWKSLYYQNTCCAETKIFQQQCQYIATDRTDTQASCIARSSATMVLTIWMGTFT